MELPTVHIPSEASRERKSACGMREALVGSRTQLINTVRGWLRGRGGAVRTGATETFPARVRAAFKDKDLPSYVARQLDAIESLTTRIAEADQELAKLAEQDATCQRLMSVPGVGPVTSVRFAAALDEVSRFQDAHAVASYVGLVPGEATTGFRVKRTSITKAGATRLRWALLQAAHTARRCRKNDPMVVWSQQVQARRGRGVAVVALARKLAGILFAIWRDGTRYVPSRGASSTAITRRHEQETAQLDAALAQLAAKR
jgi:transposase